MHSPRDNLVQILAEIDQEIAAVEDPLSEPADSDKVQRAIAVLCELHKLREKIEGSLVLTRGRAVP